MRLFDTTFLVDLVNKDPGSGKLAEKVEEQRSFKAISVIRYEADAIECE